MYEYRVLTTIPRNFDPEVEGEAIDSIVASCEDYVSHRVPFNYKGDTEIFISTSKPLDYNYIIGQLDDYFSGLGETNDRR